jgi:disulfide bond formation protein DsbB
MTPAISMRLSALGLLAVSAALAFAFADQLAYNHLPCPLCILQRAGLVAAGFGLALNLRFGPYPSHYAVVILGAITGGAVALRQILLHVVPGTGAYGTPFLGLHFYTWDFIISALIIAGSAVMLLFERQFVPREQPQRLVRFALTSFAIFALLALGNGISTVLECGGGLCPDNPSDYLLLQ